jgi:trans-2,3-dihydro-3-hydroxyanthranilate isomerase
MRYHYITVDVFTDRRFGGNQLAVLPDARGLTAEQMQAIAREFNYSETTFVLPSRTSDSDALVRIFTPSREVPFAGHPNVGTAYVLAELGQVHGKAIRDRLCFEEAAGMVPLTILRSPDGSTIATEFTAPAPLEIGKAVPDADVAAAAGLAPEQITTVRHSPLHASGGLPFTVAELPDLATLAMAKPNAAAFDDLFRDRAGDALYLYVRTGDGQVQARMFAPRHGVSEDAATGSAAAALSGLLAHLSEAIEGRHDVTISQGIEMGRPSLIQGSADKQDGNVVAVRVGGPSIATMEGILTI